MSLLRKHEDSVVMAIREALGAVAVGESATYWIYPDDAGEWCVHREDSADPQRFASRDAALAFARLAVVRCSSYCLYLQGADGRLAQGPFLGSSADAVARTLSLPSSQTHMRP